MKSGACQFLCLLPERSVAAMVRAPCSGNCTIQSLTCVAHRLVVPALLVGCVLISGCAATGAANAPRPLPYRPSQSCRPGSSTRNPGRPWSPVARYGRYAGRAGAGTGAARPDATGDRVSIPPTFDANVGVPYGTCCCAPATGSATRLRPRRCTRCRCRRHLRLGPLSCRDALLALAGPAWELSVDDASRAVCFTRVTATPAGPRRRRPTPATTEARPAQPRPSHEHPATSAETRPARAG